ncbi:MAG: N(G),N(G)-dimethylarginine dimethylaminohydrolase [Gemmatimonadales bacterium]|nr:N(G),N(G)-dimethylarginine dimethylaminohydrolase [Gemmatimonadales bacterium]
MRITRAVVRPPADTFAAGITSSRLGPPNLATALAQHDAYCRALERLGLSLLRLPPDPDFPDSTFVEDAAVVTAGGAILARPGAASRAGEVAALREVLREWFPEPAEIAAPGTLDGGDVCEAGRHFFLGISDRTNPEGAAQLAEWLARHRFGSSVIDIRTMPGLLHLKTGLSWLGDRRLLAAGELAEHDALRGWEVVRVPEGEGYAANCVRVNDTLLVARDFPATSALLGELGYDLVPLDVSEYRKMDGGLSCLSVRW